LGNDYTKTIQSLIYQIESFKVAFNIIEKLSEYVTETTEKKYTELIDYIFKLTQKSDESSKHICNFLQEVIYGKTNLLQDSKLLSTATSDLTDIRKDHEKAIDEITNISSELKKSMLKIEKYSENITDISEITSILAINASIEAARAGEHGKGFKVIAKEIQNLSSRTKKVSQEIQNMIKEMVTYSVNYFFQYIENLQGNLAVLREVNEKLIKISKNIDFQSKTVETSLNESKILSDSIDSYIKKISKTLQFQDITRQQIENITKILSKIYANFENSLNSINIDITIDKNKIEKEIHEIAEYNFTVSDEYKAIKKEIKSDVKENKALKDKELKGDITLF